MPRLPYLNRDDLSEENRDLLSRDINLMRLLVHSPGAARSFNELGMFIRHRSKLDPRLRELAILQVGWLARSRYEFSHHVKIGKGFGVTDHDIRALIAETEGIESGLDPIAKEVLRCAREMTQGLSASDRVLSNLRAPLGDECLTDLIITIAFYNAVVRILETFDIEVEAEYEQYLVGLMPCERPR